MVPSKRNLSIELSFLIITKYIFKLVFSLTELLTWLSFPTVLQLALPPDLVSAAGQMATSLRARSSSFTWGRSRLKKANKCTAVWCTNKFQTVPFAILFFFIYRCIQYRSLDLNYYARPLSIMEECSVLGVDGEKSTQNPFFGLIKFMWDYIAVNYLQLSIHLLLELITAILFKGDAWGVWLGAL